MPLMAATRADIERWFDAGIASGATHLIVVCDTFDHDDYPVYVKAPDSASERANYCRHKEMQRVVEVYDLSMDKASQMAEFRAFHY